ncbi:MAG: aminotransferase class V-fold PLP-dependent enzyme [Oligoflexia bacterium]|nr:aminotransferase class V-fold PLP-dependent enzyme [Oligoflexia bacterium]MBF0366542.1 aminotransferase class V-fold PLP-dependent enzyme [Oligoflexia bacterium]
MKKIYLDNNATTPIASEVFEAMSPFLKEEFYNPSSSYKFADIPAKTIAHSRDIVCRFLGNVSPKEVLFTSGATESNNAAIFGAIKANPSRRHIITTTIEHPAVLEVCKEAKRMGLEVTFLPVDSNGEISTRAFVQALRPKETLLVSIMHANNETGVIYPVETFARLTKETDAEILFHSDATQSIGKLPINLNENFINVDMLSMSAHKVHGPKGTGVLFIRKGSCWRPYLIGGHQEQGRRAGTENVAGITGLGRALELVWEHQAGPTLGKIRRLRDKLENALIEKVPFIKINGSNENRLPNTLNISCHFIEGEGILYQLDTHGISASSGSACTSGSLEPSHVLRAMNVPFTAIHGSVRFSLGRYNSEEDINYVIKVFPEIISNLRKISPYWNQEKNCPRDEQLIATKL